MLSSAVYHKKFAAVDTQNLLVDSTQNLLVDSKGAFLFTSLPDVIGDRVLCGTAKDELDKVIKFYFDKESAQRAVDNKLQIEGALGLAVADCPIIEGCGG